MSPNDTRARLSTKQDAEAELRIIEAWYHRSRYTAQRFEPFAPADFHVVGPDLDHVVEVKDRKYPMGFLARDGFLISVTKMEGTVALAVQYRAEPVLLVRTDESVIRMDPRMLLLAPRKMFQRERNARQRRDLPELCAIAHPDYWEEVRWT